MVKSVASLSIARQTSDKEIMTISQSILGVLAEDVQSTAIGAIIGLVTLYLLKFYFVTLPRYPNGPVPLPFLGNLLMFRGRMTHELFLELSKTYGPVYTVWTGMRPMVILASSDAILEAFVDKKNDFAGRPNVWFKELLQVTNDSASVVFQDWCRPWEVLRRVSHSAARKFAVNPGLPALEVSVIDEVVQLMLTKEGLNKPFDPNEYMYLMIYSIVASTAAGKSYSINDPEFLELKKCNDEFDEAQTALVVIDFLPFMKYFYRRQYKNVVKSLRTQVAWSEKQFDDHMVTYRPGVVRDFCDALIQAKKEAEEADAQAAVHLNRENLINALENLFQAATETTRVTLMWAILFMANYPDVQKRLRQEVADVIGVDTVPTNDHRQECHYVQAFISETLRFSPAVPLALPHKTTVDATVGGQHVPKGTTVVPVLYAQLNDEGIWGDPRVFRPERFLDPETGVHTTKNNSAFTPFSIGRRSCLGGRLAIMNLFIELTRLIQKTNDMRIVLEDGPGSVSLDPDPVQLATYSAQEYKIMIVKKNN